MKPAREHAGSPGDRFPGGRSIPRRTLRAEAGCHISEHGIEARSDAWREVAEQRESLLTCEAKAEAAPSAAYAARVGRNSASAFRLPVHPAAARITRYRQRIAVLAPIGVGLGVVPLELIVHTHAASPLPALVLRCAATCACYPRRRNRGRTKGPRGGPLYLRSAKKRGRTVTQFTRRSPRWGICTVDSPKMAVIGLLPRAKDQGPEWPEVGGNHLCKSACRHSRATGLSSAPLARCY